jgi:hypothetical protein
MMREAVEEDFDELAVEVTVDLSREPGADPQGSQASA